MALSARKESEFSRKTVDRLRDDVSNHCSLCDRLTIGPSREPDKRTNVGTAAHITAAAPGGPRYDKKLTASQRRSHENGIWCCRVCGKKIDDDASTYTVGELRSLKAKAIALAHRRVTVGDQLPMRAAENAEAVDLWVRWDEELASMEEFYDRAWRAKITLARELSGWATPFWTTRKRILTKAFGSREWWVATTTLYRLWREARLNFPTLQRYARPTLETGFRLERAVEKFKEAKRTIEHIRQCLKVEAELASISERDRADATRICEAGARSATGTFVGFAKKLGINKDALAVRLACAAWNYCCDAQPREQDAKAAELLRTGWVPSAEVMMIGGRGGSAEYDRLRKTKREMATHRAT